MRKIIICTILSIQILLFFNCGPNPPPEDEMTLELPRYDTLYVCGGLWSLSVEALYTTYYKDTADYIVYFEGIDQFGTVRFYSDTIQAYNLKYNDPQREFMRWYGWTTGGIYKIQTWFKKMPPTEQADDSIAASVTTKVVNPGEGALVKWCGDHRYGNSGDTIMYPAAYPVYIRFMANGEGIDGINVSWSASAGSLYASQNVTTTASIPDGGENLSGMAFTHLILNAGEINYTVQAKCDTDSVFFMIQGVPDTETVSNDTLKIHERWHDTLSPQITGDGYWGSNDPNNSVKNLKLEIDYDSSIIDTITIKKTLDLLRDSLYSQVGIVVSYQIDNACTSGTIDRAKEKKLLADNRNINYKGIGKGYLHVLFASQFMNDTITCGRAITYRDSVYENIGGSWCAYYGSGDMTAGGHSEKYLDSVGCIVYAKTTCMGNIPSSFVDSAHVLALITAHEIGHAIGLGHLGPPEYPEYLDYGIMSCKFYISDSLSYDHYAYFHKPFKNDYDYRWLINLRKVLGRETVDISW